MDPFDNEIATEGINVDSVFVFSVDLHRVLRWAEIEPGVPWNSYRWSFDLDIGTFLWTK